MKTFFLMTPIILALGLTGSGCKDASETPRTGGPVADRSANGTNKMSYNKMSDSDLEKAIKAKFESDTHTRQANLSVDAEANENKVSLKGTVLSQEIRTKAVESARSVHPGLIINDEIEVRPAG
jgi:osmotically-inducible protein OsmY